VKIKYSLHELAHLQLQKAHQYCREDCRGYHSSWPILRAHGLVGGIDSDREIYAQIIDEILSSSRVHDVLIAGCADTGILGMLLGSNLPDCRIDIVDRCPTPLLCCTEAVDHHPLISTIQSDLLTFESSKRYDLIVCHSLLPFFDDAGRRVLLSNFARWLAEGGRAIISLREKTAISEKSPMQRGVWSAEKATAGWEALGDESRSTYLSGGFGFGDLETYYAIIARQNLPYADAIDANKEFAESNLHIDKAYTGGVGLSFSSGEVKPRSLVLVASVVTQSEEGCL